MSEFPNILDIDNWKSPTIEKVIERIKDKNKPKKNQRWVNEGELKPIDIYCYLKARFGEPNGYTMLAKRPGSDNVIHWHYSIEIGSYILEIMGTNSSVEIVINIEKVTENQWRELINTIKKDYKNFGKSMSEIRKSLEKWTIFVNPFNRLNEIIETLESRLKSLDLTEPTRPKLFIKRYVKRHMEAKEKWFQNLAEARLLGASIRMLAPVLAESFINLVIFLLAKDEVKNDKRVYEDLIRKQIDVRVKSLYFYCDYFMEKVDDNDIELKNFLSLMNSRNDFLHGNVDPLKFKSQEVFFDKNIPLFNDEKSLQNRLGLDSIRYIEPKEALNDTQIVRGFVNYLLSHIEPAARGNLEILMKDSRPGWREDTGKVGSLFPDNIAEFFPME
ncbi:hypothetical protein [Priestia megaterium]|uniref:hypothetical protein n=1 Tax=Priestia megaterium TaxID=1404 RepID=UPI002E225BA7|nr:hypothetical protein [Priestia megaterium]